MKRGTWFLLAAAIILLAVAALMVGSSVTEQRRAAVHHALTARLEVMNAQLQARQDALRADCPTPGASSLTDDELNAFLESLEAVKSKEWNDLHTEIDNTTGPWPPDLLAKVIAWLEAHRDLLAQAQAIAQRGLALDSLLTAGSSNLQNGEDAASRFLDVSQLRTAVRILNLAAQRDAEEGRLDDAIARLLDAFAVSEAMGQHTAIITQLSRIAGYNLTLDAAARLIAQHALNDDQLDRIDRALNDAYRREYFAAAIANEAQLGAAYFAGSRNSAIGMVLRPLINMNEASYIEGIAALADVAAMPYHEAYSRIADVQQQSQALPITHYVSRTLLTMAQPAMIRALESQAAHEATVDMARIAIALERAYQETGAYPETLDAIAPHFNGELPVDPFTGHPYVYRPEADAFTLYSVGRDLFDNDGIPGNLSGDLVWNAPPLPAERPQ